MKLNYKYFYRFFLFSFYIISLLLFCFTNKSFSVNLQTDTCNFSLYIYLDKQDFIEGENIWVNIKVKNLSNKPDSLPFLWDGELVRNFKIFNEKNQKCGYWAVTHPDYFSIPYNVFQPNEEKLFELEIQRSYGASFVDSAYELSTNYFKEGAYSGYLEYKNIIDTVKSKIKSNTISFRVSKPNGVEAQAFEELKRIYKIKYNENVQPKCKEKIDAYLEFAKNYPKSVYLEIVMMNTYTAMSVFKYRYDENFINIGQSYIDNFPNSRMCMGILSAYIDIMKSLKNEDEIRSYILNIGNKYPNTRIEKDAIKLDKEVNRILKLYKQ
jgi:hypothetical protein